MKDEDFFLLSDVVKEDKEIRDKIKQGRLVSFVLFAVSTLPRYCDVEMMILISVSQLIGP